MSDLVLIVEDESDVRETLRDILAQRGYQVAVAENGRAALERLKGSEPLPCFVLVDLIMPEMSGWELLREIEADESLSDLEVAITTSAPEEAPDGLPVIPKPLDVKALLRVVARACPRQ